MYSIFTTVNHFGTIPGPLGPIIILFIWDGSLYSIGLIGLNSWILMSQKKKKKKEGGILLHITWPNGLLGC